MITRFGKSEGLVLLIFPFIIYGAVACLISYLVWPYHHQIKNNALYAIGFFAAWRYSWMLLNYFRALVYAKSYYPKLRKIVESRPEAQRYPEHIFFIIPSYKEEPWVTVETFQSIMTNLADIPSLATLIVAVASEKEDSLISRVYHAHPAKDKVELVFQYQKEGKRIAMGHALRCVARRYNDEPNSVTILMDGDSWLELGALKKTIPFFSAFRDLGALTTNQFAYVDSQSNWYKDWFNLKFGQRHILFQSHSLSNKILTLTGRFSLVRTAIVVKEDFIGIVEHDSITTWMHGKIQFLMGDDKSTWFYLMKHRWNMLYIPDVSCYSLESRDPGFWNVSVSLPYRWFGNTLRNNSRALSLGVRCTGGFIWLAILDQRLSMWTSLFGIVSALTLGMVKSFVYIPLFIAWMLFVRVVKMSIIALAGHPVSWRTIPLMLYNQWVGSIVKIRSFYYLADQSWSKGGQSKKTVGRKGIKHVLSRYMPAYTMMLSYGAFLGAVLITDEAIRVPSADFFSSGSGIHVIDAVNYGVTPNDHEDDALALQSLLDRLDMHQPVKIVLPAGQLDFSHPVVIRHSHLELVGQGMRKTHIVSTNLRIPAQAVIELRGQLGKVIGKLSQPLQADSLRLKSTRPMLVRVGDYVLIKTPNDDAFINKIGSQTWNRKYPYLRQALVKIKAVNGKDMVLASRTGVEFPAIKTRIYQVFPLQDVVLKGFSVEQKIEGASAALIVHRYENIYPDYAVDGIALNWTTGVILEQLKILNAGRHPISIENSYGFTLKDSQIRGAWNKGKGGNGYLRIARSYHGVVTHCVVKGIRHITLQWSSAFNQLSFLDTDVDINFHGGYSHDNKVWDIKSNISPLHPWPAIYHTPKNAHWAPPDGPGNTVDSKF
ncbi:MAG: glycosyltransferase [Gallionella sp.]